MSDWRKEKIENHIDMLMGFAFKSKDFSSQGVRLIRGDNVTEGKIRWGDKTRYWPEVTKELEHYLLHDGDIVIGMDGSKVGRNWARITKEDIPSLLVQRVARIRSKQSLNQRFLEFLISSDLFKQHVDSIKTGSSIPHISGGQIRDFEIPFPPLNQQKAVAEILGSISDKIELNQRMNETLEAMARALFKSWFMDFDPVRAKTDGRKPEGMDAATAALFPATFNDDGLPEGWSLHSVEDVLELSYGKALKKEERVAGDVPVYGSGGITGFNNQSLVEGPGIIVGRKGTVGSLYWEQRNFYPIDTVFYVVHKVGYSLEYAYYLLQTLGLETMNTDAAVPGLNRNNAYRLDVVKTSPDIIAAFTKTVSFWRSMVDKNARESSTLADLRDALLPKLISGELRIDDVKGKQGN